MPRLPDREARLRHPLVAAWCSSELERALDLFEPIELWWKLAKIDDARVRKSLLSLRDRWGVPRKQLDHWREHIDLLSRLPDGSPLRAGEDAARRAVRVTEAVQRRASDVTKAPHRGPYTRAKRLEWFVEHVAHPLGAPDAPWGWDAVATLLLGAGADRPDWTQPPAPRLVASLTDCHVAQELARASSRLRKKQSKATSIR